MRRILLFAILVVPVVFAKASGNVPVQSGDSLAMVLQPVAIGGLPDDQDVLTSDTIAAAGNGVVQDSLSIVTEMPAQQVYDGVQSSDSVDVADWPTFEKVGDGRAEIMVVRDSLFDETVYYRGRKPDADKAVWFSAVLPGLGQIYNRQYWKLPIIYGGALGIAYAITWNNQMYVDYRKAYLDLIDSDPDTRSYENLLPNGTTIDDSNRSTYERTFQNGQETYLRYRDLSIIAAGVLYILTMIDAYVDAQLFDYDISPDLSVKVAPAVIPSSTQEPLDASVGVRCRVRF